MEELHEEELHEEGLHEEGLHEEEEEDHVVIHDWGVLVQRVHDLMVHVMAPWSDGKVVHVRWEDDHEEHQKDLGIPLHEVTHSDDSYLQPDCA